MSTREERLKKLQEAYSRRENISSGTSVSADPERERRLQVLQNHYNNVYLPKQVNAWAQEMNEFSKKISADAQARSKGYQSQESLKAYQDSISGQLNDLISRSKYAQQYASLNPNDINFNTSIKDTLDYLNNITKGLQDEQSYWSQWANEDAYKASPYYFDNEYADAAKNYDTDVIKAKNDAYNDKFSGNNFKLGNGVVNVEGFLKGAANELGIAGEASTTELTDNEARMYAYIRDTVGLDEARRYIKSIQEDLSYRKGVKNANKTASMMGLITSSPKSRDAINITGKVDSLNAGLLNALSGLQQTTINILNPIDNDNVVTTPYQVYSHRTRQENDTEFGKVVGDLAFTTGNMLPSIVVSAVSKSPLLGAGITAMSSGGNAYAEARRQGYSHEQATAYGMINGALEGGLQYALGGIGKLGGKLSGKLINKIGDKLLPAFSNIKSGVARAVLSAGGKFLGNAASEAFEEGLQSVLDPLVRNMVLQEDINIDWNEVAYSAMLGAMSAGLWEGGSIVTDTAQANAIGKKAFDNGSWKGALDYALALDPNSKPYQLAKALQDGSIKADGNNVGNLYSALVEYMQESKTLVRKGKMTTDQYVSARNAISQIYEARSKAEAENNASADISPNIMSASLYQEIKGLGLDEKTATKYSNAIANLKQGTEVSDKITNELISGNSPVKHIVARELGIDTTNKTAAELRNAVKSYVDTVKSQPKVETAEQTAPKTEKELQYEQAKAATAQLSKALGEKGQAVYNEFSEGMRTGDSLMYFNNAVFDFYNQGVEASLKKNPPKKYTDIARYEGIAPVIKQKAFEAGKLDNAAKAEAVKKTEEKVKSDIKEIKARQKELKHVEFDIKDLAPSAGKWTVDEGVDVDNLKGKQNAAFNYLKAVSEVSGINVHIMSGVKANGELTTENGFYDSETNTVYVSINAGAQSLTDITNTVILKTASHEITHYIAATDTDAYQELRDYVVETFKKEHGEDGLSRRVSEIQDIYLDQINKELTYEKAIEEMVANACETMIRNSKVFSQLVRQNMTVAERLKDGLDRFITKMDKNREAALEGSEETSLEARLIASNADTLKKAQELWDNALKAAIKKNQEVDAKTESDSRMMNLRYDETEFNARRELSTALLTVAQTDAERRSLENYQKMVKALNEQEELLGKMKDKLAQIDKAKEFKRYTELEKNIRGVENKINYYDSKLINLEATKPLKDIVARKEARLKEQFARSSTTRAKHRNNIKKNIRSLDQKLRTNSGQKHILKEFQPVIASLLETFTDNTSVFKKDQLATLKALYAQFKPDPTMIVEGGKHGNDVANKYDDVEYAKDLQAYTAKYVPIIAENIDVIAPIMENKRLIDLDAETLTALDQVISNINHIIVGSEEIFVNNKAEALRGISEDSLTDMVNSGYKPSTIDDNFVKDFLEYKNTLPVYVMERLGDTVMKYLWKPLEDGAANMVREQVADTKFLHSKMREHNAKSWQDETFRIKLESGKEIALTQEQAMYIYAAAKREATHKGVGGKKINHLGKGGITIPNIVKEDIIGEDGKPEKYLGLIPKKKKNLKDKQGTPLTDNDISKIDKLLSQEQKKYVDEVVKYLSTTIADRGNKVSRQLYGIDLFNETYYIPLMSAEDYLNVSFMGQTEKLIKNAGTTKSLTQGANNPIVVDDFTTIVAQHLQQMERYDSLAVPLDNFNRWLNYQSYDEDAKGNRTKNGNGVRMTMGNVYGDEMQRYINQLLKDANAASTKASNEGLANQLIGKFRKNAVLASLSVAMQQPSAMGRALAYIDLGSFFKNVDKLSNKENIEQMLKYSNAAFIKENGSFDPAVSKNAIDQMLYLEPETASEKIKALFAKDGNYRDELLGALPKAMDRVTWGKIWRAVKAETAKSNPELDVTSKEFLELVAERFDYVINRTQVYDSTLSKSELMRSKSAWWKLNTSFAAEATTAYNMLLKATEDVAHAKTPQAKKMAVAFFGRTVAAYTIANILNAVLKSLVTAARKDKMDDENDKSYIEWYVQEVLSNFLTDSNPLSLLPLVRDVWSLMQGYDLSRTDMEAVVMFKDAVESVVNENKPLEQKLADILKALGIAFGVPVENILRDGEAIINVIVDIFDGWETSWQGIADAAQSGVADVTKWDIAPESGNTADKLYKAMMNGDTNAYKQYYADIVEEFNKKKQEGKTDSKNVESYIRSQMRKRLVDSAEIKAAYEASKASNFAAYDAAVKALTSKGFHPNDVRSAINSYEERLKKAETSEPTVEEYEEEDVKLDKGLLVDAIANGKELEVIAAEQSKYKKGSQEYKDNAAKIKRYITQELKPLYQDYFLQGNTAAYNAIAKRLVALRQYGINYDADTLADWRKKAKEDRA